MGCHFLLLLRPRPTFALHLRVHPTDFSFNKLSFDWFPDSIKFHCVKLIIANWKQCRMETVNQRRCYVTFTDQSLTVWNWTKKWKAAEMSFYILNGMWNRWPTLGDYFAEKTFPGSSLAWEITSLASAPTTEMSQQAFTICIIKRYQPTIEERKKLAPLKVKPKSELAGFFNSLHTDARFHVGAIWYYVSLHTSAESTFYAFFLQRSRLVFLVFLFAVPFMCTYLLHFSIFIQFITW